MEVIHCNFLSVKHGFPDSEVFLQAGYYVIMTSTDSERATVTS